jgi:hypothetical protein
MLTVKFDAKKLTKTVNNIIQYSDGFISETRQSKQKIVNKMAATSVNAFYEYLDGLARVHPTILHHVYEWGEVGNPLARLFELNMSISSSGAVVGAEFLESTSIPTNGTEPFYNKAEVMENGETVIVNEKDAQALFFEIDGEEFFRRGPIVIANPGGEAVRGSFIRAFNEFYISYFNQIYLKSINFHKHLSNPYSYSKNIRSAVKGGNARSAGKNAAIQWISTLPGDDVIGS